MTYGFSLVVIFALSSCPSMEPYTESLVLGSHSAINCAVVVGCPPHQVETSGWACNLVISCMKIS